MLNGQAATSPVIAPQTPRLRLLADVVNRGDSQEAQQSNYAGQISPQFPAWLERNQTRTVYEWNPSVPFPPDSLEAFIDPDYLSAFLKGIPAMLAVYGVTADFSGVLALDWETFTSRIELSLKGTADGWAAKFPGTPYPLGFEIAMSRVMAEIGRCAPLAKRTIWSFPWLAPWLDQAGPASVLKCRGLNQKWGPPLVRSLGCLNPAMYPISIVGSMRALFDEVAVLTNEVRPPGMEAWADVCITYPTGALPPELQAEQPPGGASRVPISAQHFEEACISASLGRFTGVVLWGPIWDRADFSAKARWIREVFVPVSRRYFGSPAAETA